MDDIDNNTHEQTDSSAVISIDDDAPNAPAPEAPAPPDGPAPPDAGASELFLREPYTRPARDDYFNKGRRLYKAARNGKWEDLGDLRNRNEGRAFITAGHETALHISALAGNVEFVRNLLENLEAEDLEITNARGNTALCLAAANGNVEIAEMLISKHREVSPAGTRRLPDIRGTGSSAFLPVMLAATLGNGEMVQTLRVVTNLNELEIVELLKKCIASDLFDSAREIIEANTGIAASHTGALEMLVTKPMAERSEKSIWKIFCCQGRQQADPRHVQALELLKYILKLVFTMENQELDIASTVRIAGQLLFDAAQQGNFHFVKWMIYYYPEIVWEMNEDHLSMFHVAVKFRHERIFTLLYNMDEVRKLVTTYEEKDTRNNMLHLAATVAPKDKLDAVNGAAFQMQRAICWYKAVEKIVPPAYRNMLNQRGKRPADIFDEEHKELLKGGEKWMKDTAKSCMVVAALSATVMFTSAFTAPGDFDDKGHPNLLNRGSFDFLTVSEVIGMLSSSTSILMFLSILTSRFNKYAFRNSLPCKLMIGLVTLFVSIVSMLMAFCTAIYLSYGHTWLLRLLFPLACVPILVLCLRFGLLCNLIYSIWVTNSMFKSTRLSDY